MAVERRKLLSGFRLRDDWPGGGVLCCDIESGRRWIEFEICGGVDKRRVPRDWDWWWGFAEWAAWERGAE